MMEHRAIRDDLTFMMQLGLVGSLYTVVQESSADDSLCSPL